MDEFGVYQPLTSDFSDLAYVLRTQGGIVFSYSADQSTAFVIFMASKFKVLGCLPFGGNPLGSVLVSILYKSCFWFDMYNQSELSEDYVAEKLGLVELEAAAIALLLNGIRKAYQTTAKEQ